MTKAQWTLASRIMAMGTGLGALTVLQGVLSLATMYETRRAIEAEDRSIQQATQYINRGIPAVWVILLFTIISGTSVALLFARMVRRTMAPLEKAVQLLGQGILKGDIDIQSNDDIGCLTSYMNGALDQMTRTVSGIDYCSDRISEATRDMVARTVRAAEMAVDQRDRVREIGDSMSDMVANVRHISLDSASASELAEQAINIARDGAGVVDEALHRMKNTAVSVGSTAVKVEKLGSSSEQIGKVVAVINEIAEQTNLLALNAAIEAARAGVHGRGFAVVAAEVRRLSERTSSATNEVATMIGSLQGETREAVALMKKGAIDATAGLEAATKAGGSLESIITAANNVGQTFARISASANEQDVFATEINASLTKISALTKAFAEDVEQSKASCENLSTLAGSLKEIIGEFRFRQIIRSAAQQPALSLSGATISAR